MPQIVDLSSEKEFKDIIFNDKTKLTVVDCYADWCGPCKVLGKLYTDYASKYTHNNVNFCKLDVDNQEFATFTEANQISALPTVLFLKGDDLVDKMVGANFEKLKQLIETHAGPISSTLQKSRTD